MRSISSGARPPALARFTSEAAARAKLTRPTGAVANFLKSEPTVDSELSVQLESLQTPFLIAIEVSELAGRLRAVAVKEAAKTRAQRGKAFRQWCDEQLKTGAGGPSSDHEAAGA